VQPDGSVSREGSIAGSTDQKVLHQPVELAAAIGKVTIGVCSVPATRLEMPAERRNPPSEQGWVNGKSKSRETPRLLDRSGFSGTILRGFSGGRNIFRSGAFNDFLSALDFLRG
jgi:hypothetical protein